MALSNAAKNKILLPYRTLVNSRIIETASIKLNPVVTWGSDTKTLTWSISAGQATSSMPTYSISAGKDPNVLRVWSNVGALNTPTATAGDAKIETMEDIITGNKTTGSRGYDGKNFLLVKIDINVYDILVDQIGNTALISYPDGGTLTSNKAGYYNKVSSEGNLSDRAFPVKVDNGFGYEYLMVRNYQGKNNSYTLSSDKYEVVYTLLDHTSPMEFNAPSTITTRVRARMEEQ